VVENNKVLHFRLLFLVWIVQNRHLAVPTILLQHWLASRSSAAVFVLLILTLLPLATHRPSFLLDPLVGLIELILVHIRKTQVINR